MVTPAHQIELWVEDQSSRARIDRVKLMHDAMEPNQALIRCCVVSNAREDSRTSPVLRQMWFELFHAAFRDVGHADQNLLDIEQLKQPAQRSTVRALREPLQDKFCGCHIDPRLTGLHRVVQSGTTG